MYTHTHTHTHTHTLELEVFMSKGVSTVVLLGLSEPRATAGLMLTCADEC
jgi:hypothetical protein